MVIDPPAGRVPPVTPGAQARQGEINEYQQALMQNTVVCRGGLPGCPGEYGPPSPRREEQPPYYDSPAALRFVEWFQRVFDRRR